MITLTRVATLALPALLLAPACSSSDVGDPTGRVRLEAASAECSDVQTVCLETYPPQCFDVCADDDPGDPDGGDDDCVSSDGDLVQCGDDTCIDASDGDGQEVLLCAGDDCVVSYDVETGEESFSCPPSDGDGDGDGDDDGGAGGSEPGFPGNGEPAPDDAGTAG